MALTTEWKEEAEAQLDQILHYNLANYGKRAAGNLYASIDQRLRTLSKYPESGGKIAGDSRFRYVQIRKSHYLYYTFNDSELLVVGLYGSKQEDNPYL